MLDGLIGHFYVVTNALPVSHTRGGGPMRHVGRSLFTMVLLAALLPAVAAMQAQPQASQARAAGAVAEHVLGGFEDVAEDWQVNLGGEFPGAQGQLTRDDQQPHSGTYAGRLHTDFSAGGNYVEAFRGID